MHPGKRLIVPAGPAKTRSNDTEYQYRAHSAFAHLTGWGSDSVADSVLVLEPTASGHEGDALLQADRPSRHPTSSMRTRRSESSGPAPGHRSSTSPPTLRSRRRPLDDFTAVLDAVDASTLLVRDADRDITDQVDGRRLLTADSASVDDDGDEALARDLSELRLVKDDFEQAQMRGAIAATKQGFDDVIGDLPNAIAHRRGERIVEGTFNRRARADGNTVGYETIAASGPHACILHWTRNDGPVREGDLILIDAGIELDSYYTADITRTLPVNGTFSPIQRQVYEAVREAADAAFAIVKPGVKFRELHAAAMKVIAAKTAGVGVSPRSAPRSRSTRPTSTTAATWCTAPATISGSTCTTARRLAGSSTWTASCRRAWCSRSSRGSTSSPTTSRCPRSSAASVCGSRTTSS